MARHHDVAVTYPSEAGYPQPATRANPVVVAEVADSATPANATVADATADSESCSNDPAASSSCTRVARTVSSPTAVASAGPDGTGGDITDGAHDNDATQGV
ncbi:MAG TPA: hypothetical protein VIC82_06345 [Candidatus Nanopelagicales bacterium]